MNLLAISGSLRAASINSAFCRVVARLAPASLPVTVFSGLGELPLFNPDLESSLPRSVQEFRTIVGRADALLIASPEYAHGISGVMKNALDWLVSYEGTVHKPVALINTSPRARHAYQSLREILQTMSASIIDEASISLPLLGSCTTEDAMLSAPEVHRSVQAALAAIVAHLAGSSPKGPTFPLA
ncbi:NADPH-dependent FMN reductase [Polaromonas sp.]|uniref:NADPH-dependent FMN reductase n=1 Tax=Polaromonas sp. TaxID=1869339 RepID=UPI0024885C56|nr:NADPH-dependent FMN reductase [Polaromonas sp.]MDI1342306.1 NAD(P)H-dependent oxidoreductase [Polaromonas sp.]